METDSFQKTFMVYQRNLDFLKTINPDNDSDALRTVLDNAMKKQTKNEKKQVIDTSVLFIGFGVITILFSLNTPNPLIVRIGSIIGVFLFLYGTIGGLISVLQTTRRPKRN